MANFQIPGEPGYTEEVRKFETTDPAHADLFNGTIQKLVENDAYLKRNKQDAMTVDSALSATSTNPVQNRVVKAALDGKSGTGHTHSAASTTANGFMSSADKKKLDGIDENANAYTHPSTHPASMVSQDATHRFVTDAEKQAWDGTYEQSTGYTDQKIADLIGGDQETLGTLKDFAEAVKENGDLITAMNESIGKKADKAVLDAHTGNSTIHITSSERQKWNAKQDAMTVDSALSATSTNPVQNKAVKAALDGKSGTGHTHSAASTTANGFMSAADKQKLNGIETNANAYTHPSTHPATMIDQDEAHRFVTDDEKLGWASKEVVGAGKKTEIMYHYPHRDDGELSAAYKLNVSIAEAISELSNKLTFAILGMTPADIGAPSSSYIAENFTAGYTTAWQDTVLAKGWYRIAYIPCGALSSAQRMSGISCGITIKRSWHTGSPDFHSVQLLVAGGAAKFVSSAHKNTNAVAKIRYVYDTASTNAYLEIYYIASGVNRIYYTIDKAVSTDNVKWRTMAPVAVSEEYSGMELLASMDFPDDFDTSMLVEKSYLEEHFVADYISQEDTNVSGAGWKRIAEFSRPDGAMGQCIVDIKREYMEDEDEYHRFFYVPTHNRFNFFPIVSQSNAHIITKVRCVTNVNGKSYIEIYYNSNNTNLINVSIESATSAEFSSITTWKAISATNEPEQPSVGTVKKTFNIPANFNANMLAMKDGSNASGTWENITAGKALALSNVLAIGGNDRPVYIGADGVPKPISGNVGASARPIYMQGGVLSMCQNIFERREMLFYGSFSGLESSWLFDLHGIDDDGGEKFPELPGSGGAYRYIQLRVILLCQASPSACHVMKDVILSFRYKNGAAGSATIQSEDIVIGGSRLGNMIFTVGVSECTATSVGVKVRLSSTSMVINKIEAIY